MERPRPEAPEYGHLREIADAALRRVDPAPMLRARVRLEGETLVVRAGESAPEEAASAPAPGCASTCAPSAASWRWEPARPAPAWARPWRRSSATAWKGGPWR